MSIERLVCTKILGLKSRLVKSKRSKEVYEVWGDECMMSDGRFDDPQIATEVMLDAYQIPNVCQDMNEAWCVVRKMKQRGWTVSISNKDAFTTAYFYRVPKGKRPAHRDKRVRQAMSEFPAVAICIAALYALGVTDKEMTA